jgi:cell division cycle protein 37
MNPVRMISGDKRAIPVFKEDVERTYAHIVNRVNINKEEAAQREQIQLVAENPDTTISFNVPDGPPPENLVLEGPGTEGLDIEEVRKALQFRWDVFEGYSDDLKEALKTGELDGVNKVLGEMEVPEAEAIVQSLDAAGILNFAEGGIRDETGKA